MTLFAAAGWTGSGLEGGAVRYQPDGDRTSQQEKQNDGSRQARQKVPIGLPVSGAAGNDFAFTRQVNYAVAAEHRFLPRGLRLDCRGNLPEKPIGNRYCRGARQIRIA